MNRWLTNVAANLDPYVPGEQPTDPSVVKLNTNENPYPPSPKVQQALETFDYANLRLYPPPEAERLCKVIADTLGVLPENVYVANGSDEVLAWCFPAFFQGRAPLLINDITYSFYPVYASLFSVPIVTVPLNESFLIEEDSFYQKNGGVLIANPNAPTGAALSLAQIEQIVSNNTHSVVVVDEAYIDFGGQSAVELIPRYENLLVVQTVSKSRSLAGLRLGYAVGSKKLIEGLSRIKNSYNSYTVDLLCQTLAIASFKDRAYFEQTIQKIIKTRTQTVKRLQVRGFDVIDSAANFLFVSHESIHAKELYEKLSAANILVRHFNRPRISNRLRITIGTDEQMDGLMQCLDVILNDR